MRKFQFCIQYDGKNFCGFQSQPSGKSIQQSLENALCKISNEEVRVVASGRTDSGVHAVAQIAHFVINNDSLSCDNLLRGMNSFLPDSIKVIWIKQVSLDFDAQKCAKQKTYEYLCYISSVPLPLMFGRALQLNSMPNLAKMRKAAKFLVGKHDFSAFCAANSGRTNFVRTIFKIRILKKKSLVPIISFKITGNGFLYKMVRNIVGLLLDVGFGKLSLSDFLFILNFKNKQLASKTAFAYVFYFFFVYYFFMNYFKNIF